MKDLSLVLLVVGQICVLVSCTDDSASESTGQAGTERWPVEEEGLEDSEQVIDGANVRSLYRANYGRVAAIGSLGQPVREVFGEVSDVAIDRGGRVLVLDATIEAIAGFSTDGEYLFTIGGSGGGPGEFKSPVAIATSSDGDLFLADANHRITHYSWEDSIYELVGSFSTDVRPVDIASCGNRVIIHGTVAKDDRIIWAYGRTGELRHAFGEQYDSKNSIVRFTLSWGSIWCTEVDGRAHVVYMPEMTGPNRDFGLTSFSVSGEKLWHTKLEEFRPIGYRIDKGGRGVAWTWVPDEGAHYALAGSHIGGSGISEIQVAFQDSTREAVDDYQEIVTIFLDEETGAVLAGTDGIPEVGDIVVPFLATIERSPYPKVNIEHLEGSER